MLINPLLVGPVLEIGKALLDRFGPEDKGKRMVMEAEFFKMAAEGELKQVIAQLEINARESQHASVWVAGWRPYFGWVGGTGFLYVVLLKPFLAWWARIKGWPEPPDVDVEVLMVVVTGLLGIGGLRTYEKRNRIETK